MRKSWTLEAFRHAAAALALAGLTACASTEPIGAGKDAARFERADFDAVRFRAPTTPVFDPEAPAEKRVARDDAGNALPVARKELGRLDCEESRNFFARLGMAKVTACLRKLSVPTTSGAAESPGTLVAEWRLRKEDSPYLELEDPDESPSCLRDSLGKIPFPRELVFVEPVERPAGPAGECYTSRLSIGAGTIAGWEVPAARVRLKVAFPLARAPKSAKEAERLLRLWILSIYRGGTGPSDGFRGRFLPTRYCKMCFGIPESSPLPPPAALWPVDDAAGASVR